MLNAGVFSLGKVGEMPPLEFGTTLALNLVAPYTLLHAFIPRMQARGRGHVMTIGSIADRVAYPENGAYAASKFGARALHQVVRTELGGSGVRASLVAPGRRYPLGTRRPERGAPHAARAHAQGRRCGGRRALGPTLLRRHHRLSAPNASLARAHRMHVDAFSSPCPGHIARFARGERVGTKDRRTCAAP